MADDFHEAADAQSAEDADTMPAGVARQRAEDELSVLEPAGDEPFHIGQDEVVTQIGEDPISDFTGRGNGP